MTQPSFTCPRCRAATTLPSDVAAGYCPTCRWWTGDSLLGSADVIAQAELDGPLAYDPWRGLREMSDALGRHHRRTAVEHAERLSTWLARCREILQPAFDLMPQRAILSMKSLTSVAVAAGMLRRTEKRMRDGSVRVRYKRIAQPQPRPWKVNR